MISRSQVDAEDASHAKKLIVGVDYGTTYSGVSWVWSDATSVKDIMVINEWPGPGQSDNYRTKVPSRICYEGPGAWGYEIRPSEFAYSWTKLLLDKVRLSDFDDQSLRNIDPGLLALPSEPVKTAEDVVTDFLARLYKHVMQHLEGKVSKEVLDVTEINFWFSMPATWGDRAQMRTRAAASRAGFGNRGNDKICMIREPEAAAIACLNDLIADSPSPLVQQGEGVLVCDCGGGTVDLASYEVVRPFPRLELHETCVSKGGKCGSTTIDRAFHDLLKKRFGDAFTRVPMKRKGVNSIFMNHWEGIKKDFGHTKSNHTHWIPLMMKAPSSDYYVQEVDDGICIRGELKITSDDMKELFQPVVQKIKALISKQIEDTKKSSSARIKTILLVGGFGQSRYLYSELRAWCASTITILNPPGCWEAICKGAALRGLEGVVVRKRKCPRNYGVEIKRNFRPGIDSETDSFICPYERTKMACGYMNWIFEKGDDIFNDTTRTRQYGYILTDSRKRKQFSINFYQSNMALAPERKKHTSVEKVGKLIVDLSEVDFSIFPSRLTTIDKALGTRYFTSVHSIAFEIHTSVVDESIGIMNFKAMVQGKERGSVKLKFPDDQNATSTAFE